MATSKINYTVTNGNLFSAIAGEDHISSLLFDVSKDLAGSDSTADGEIYNIFSLEEAEDLGIDGIIDPDAPTGAEYENGVVHKHISDFFAINPNGELYIGLADMSTNFNFLTTVQTVAQGRLRQQGIYTSQELFTAGTPYTVNHTAAIEAIANADALNNRPYSVVLHANVATVSSGAVDVDIAQIPSAIGNESRVSVTIGQGNDSLTNAVQNAHSTKATVGAVGAMIALVSRASVHESIGWISKFNLASVITTISFGFGGVLTDITDNTPYESLSSPQIDSLDTKGYIFPHKYVGYVGTYASSEVTLSSGDYRTIARNRAIDKSRRVVRASLLPTIQQPLYVDPATGSLSAGTIAQYKTIIHQQLQVMQANGEMSGFSITIDPTQDVLTTDTVAVKYRLIPVGVAKQINIEIGLSRSI
tara:strand:+ start:363 stop:1616 length:1254 start_codon:yes stop_codon:yes gene_type:complete